MSAALGVPIEKIQIVSVQEGSICIKITVDQLCEGINDLNEKKNKLLKCKKAIKKHIKDTLGKEVTAITITEEKTFKLSLKDFDERGNIQMNGDKG